MAFTEYTSPAVDAVTGVVAPASLWNTYVRDNGRAMGPHFIARKTADQSVTSSTVLVNDTHLLLPVGASEVWHARFCLSYTGANGTGDLKVAFTFPTAGDIRMTAYFNNQGGTALAQNFSGTTTPTTAKDFNARGATEKTFLVIEGIFVNSTNAGNLQLQWAQQTSSGTATTLYTHSTLWAVKLL
jgi:hypothetical protein